MDLAVLMDGVVHTLTGVSESTTCKEVVYTLAHAKGRTGRFVLQLILQQQEKPLLPSDRPLVMLRNLKERAKHAVFALRSADGAEEMAASCGESTKKSGYCCTLIAYPKCLISIPKSYGGSGVRLFYFRTRLFRSHSMATCSVYPTKRSNSLSNWLPFELLARPAQSNLRTNCKTRHSHSLFFCPSLTRALFPHYGFTAQDSTQTGCSTSVVSSDSYVFKTSASSSSMNFSKPRPPPPDYNTFMAQRFNSLTRNKMARNSDSKREIIHQQELRLVKDESMCSGEELELIQLERQLENLEIILKPLRASNFERQYNDEYNKALRLQMAINAKKADIATLQDLTEEEDLLTKELFNNMTLMDCAALESSSVLTKKQFI